MATNGNIKSVFDWTKELTGKKRPWDSFSSGEHSVFNAYMVHKVLSMDPSNITIVNEIQQFPPQNFKEIYSIYREYIPKSNKWNKYIKSKTKQPNKDLTLHIADHFKCSIKEAKENITLLGSSKINTILENRGLDKKEIKKLLK